MIFGVRTLPLLIGFCLWSMTVCLGGEEQPSEIVRCDREMRKTFEALQAWRRLNHGAFPERLADLKTAGLLPSGGAICPSVAAEQFNASARHSLITSHNKDGDPKATYEYELSGTAMASEGNERWLPAETPPISRRQYKTEILRRPNSDQMPFLRCKSHQPAAPAPYRNDSTTWRNLPYTGSAYWSGEYWEQNWLQDVPYTERHLNILFGGQGPPFNSGLPPRLAAALDLRGSGIRLMSGSRKTG